LTPPPAPEPETPKGRFTIKGTSFLLEGKPFRFVGVNVRELAYYGYSGWGLGHIARPEFIDVQLQTAREMGARVFRLYAPFSKDAGGFDRTDLKEAIRRLKNVLDKAQKYGLFALITLDDAKQSGFHVATDFGRFRDPANMYNMAYYRSGYRETYIPFVRGLVDALGGHPAIFAWGVCNEAQVNPFIPPTPPDSDCQAFLDYFKHASETIKSFAPTDLVTTSIESCHHLFVVNAYEGKRYANKLYGLSTTDFATIHSYQDQLRMDNILGHNYEIGLKELELAKKTWKKPVVIEEMGPVGGKFRAGADNWVRNALAEWFRQGAAGCMQWGFSAADSDIGVGDADSGMHHVPADHPALVGADWDDLFSAYKNAATSL
jgi:endo-1,4-beta-mannosidase